MIPSKLTIGELNEINKPLTPTDRARLRWARFMEQKDKLPECKSRLDVAELGGFDVTTERGRRDGISWVRNMVKHKVLEEVRTPGTYSRSTFRIIGVPPSVKGVRRKKAKKAEKVEVKPVEKVEVKKMVEKPVEKLADRSISLTVRRGRKEYKIEANFKGVSEAFAEEQIKELISKLK